MSEDPIRYGVNWYTYCGNNPILFVDPWGLAHYIFFNDSNQEKAANSTMQQILDKDPNADVRLIHVTSNDIFTDYWNNEMGTHDGTIDSVFVHLHGEYNFIHGGSGTKIYVSDLERKTIDTIFLTACSTGNMNHIGNNVASQLAMTQDVNQVIAPDGLGYFVTSTHVLSLYFPDSDGTNIVREGNGFVLYQSIGGRLLVTPGLTDDGSRGALETINIFNRGNMMGQVNSGLHNVFGIDMHSRSDFSQRILNNLIK